ncbi:MAG: cob(I)yrinic acid a,c-diamide adenosyltransferase [Candidatus Marinimicrobia bacterium]|mgnify:FL=1|jgi:cob(I)alamin adenosyltransferase|nr:cob(I)yrinic acid a,c-diamide adenosyltransferase [Candidatus Neomarinimicrobiota bacterium]MBT3501843.1 cob(I)yrinic acid a,c-diamide adenosyltransferase [Candidatus Neomarinimicrobiota bacterium]MBT3838631.1 cob(I)yrinic acid a,c-diamide adenosyltransferase [Candidatus Neomarinimicrobiota bacterium]MBT3999755.1 cob(I)yrinic acid a,c-diamide adenosyltransferase [Candidatus Neomarinimicrobiota bacterium]MBT4578624.1 cob(I)yrinic acid a,c-diamide adenosyltransferase [Candidatus Neomarinimicro
MRISKTTTKSGDKGETGLGDGTRISKNNIRINVLGEIDHLNSILGWAAVNAPKNIKVDLELIQQDLFNIGGELSIPNSNMNLLTKGRILWLESEIENLNGELPPLKEFILPGGSELSARIHIARTETRNTERTLVALFVNENRNDLHLVYLNRLSDYLFILARKVQSKENLKEIQWNHKK